MYIIWRTAVAATWVPDAAYPLRQHRLTSRDLCAVDLYWPRVTFEPCPPWSNRVETPLLDSFVCLDPNCRKKQQQHQKHCSDKLAAKLMFNPTCDKLWIRCDIMRSFDVTHSKQRRTKSKKRASLVLTACASSFDAGRRFLPLLLVIQRGTFFESGTTAKSYINTKTLVTRRLQYKWASHGWKLFYCVPKKSLLLVACSSMFCGGRPITSMIQANCSTSFSPGNSG